MMFGRRPLCVGDPRESDIERVASVWYEEPHHRTVEQTMAELEELVEEPGAEGNLA